MAPPPSDPSNQDVVRRQKKEPICMILRASDLAEVRMEDGIIRLHGWSTGLGFYLQPASV